MEIIGRESAVVVGVDEFEGSGELGEVGGLGLLRLDGSYGSSGGSGKSSEAGFSISDSSENASS